MGILDEPTDQIARKKWPIYAIFVHGSTHDTPSHAIQSFKNLSARSSKNQGRNAYWVSGLIFCAVLACSGFAFALPHVAGAFWPFSITRADTNPSPIIDDASMDMLAAPLSSNPIAASTSSPAPVTTPDGSALVPIGNANIKGADPAVDQLSIPTAGGISEYTVKTGDSLSEIAQSHGVSTNTILWANNITDPSTIKAGTKLVILPVSGIQHTVRSGETLASIAKKFGADVSDIAQYNGISADGALVSGTTIIIPGGELPAVAPVKAAVTTKTTTSKGTTSSIAGKISAKLGIGSNLSLATGNPYKGGSGSEIAGYFQNPVPGALLTQGIHGWNGVDLGVPTGTPIHAAAAGTVILSRTGGWNGGYGNYVIIDHGNGIQTLYAHMVRTAANVGDTVSAGEVIGYVGTTGEATGPHVHFEVRGARNPFADCTPMKVCSPE